MNGINRPKRLHSPSYLNAFAYYPTKNTNMYSTVWNTHVFFFCPVLFFLLSVCLSFTLLRPLLVLYNQEIKVKRVGEGSVFICYFFSRSEGGEEKQKNILERKSVKPSRFNRVNKIFYSMNFVASSGWLYTYNTFFSFFPSLYFSVLMGLLCRSNYCFLFGLPL